MGSYCIEKNEKEKKKFSFMSIKYYIKINEKWMINLVL